MFTRFFLLLHIVFLLTAEYGNNKQAHIIPLKSEKIYFDDENIKANNIVLSHSSYQRGKVVEIILPIEINGSHYISWKDSNSIGLPTKLDLKLPKGISLQKIEFSPPNVYESDIVGRVLQMKGKSYFLILLKLSEKIDLGKKDLELLFFYQLCKKDLCFFPKTQKLEFVIQVSQNKGKKNQQFYELIKNFPQERALEEIVTKNPLGNELVNLSMNKKDVDYLFFFDRPKESV